MEALIALALLGILWLTSSRRWKRQFVTPAIILVLIYTIVTSPITAFLSTQGLTFFLPKDEGESVDAIVVLGRGGDLRSSRTEIAAQLWRAQRAPKIFASGMLDAREIVEKLKHQEVPAQKLSGEACSQTTEENALFTSALLHPQGDQKILLVTDPPHLLRSWLIFRSFQFTPIPYASSPQWSSREQVFMTFREYLALLQYALTGRFKQRTTMDLKRPSVEITNKMTNWNCKISG